MSASPEPRATSEDPKVDAVDDTTGDRDEAPSAEPPLKRKRGRPPGSKNKKTLEAQAAGPSTADAPRRPRGRPPKRKAGADDKKDEDGEPTEERPKKKRGRPRKNPIPERTDGDGGETSAAADSSAPKKKRGRPRKNSS